MKIFVIVIFGSIGLIMIFLNFDMLMEGVATGNSSVLGPTYVGFNEVVNSLPWAVPVGFVLLLGFAWWFSRKRR